MNRLWIYIDSKKWQEATKYKIILIILGSLFGLIGCILWLIVRSFVFSSPKWLFCFVGYPIIISWVVVLIYSGRHDFHDGKQK